MPFSKKILAVAAVGAAIVVAPSSGRANIEYPWCAVYGGDFGGASNCGFTTWEQCMATVSGIGGFCDRNQFYTGPEPAQPRRVKRKRPNG